MKYSGKSGSFKLGPWPGGINNVKDEARLTAAELRDSENFVYDDRGEAETRAGLVKRISGTALSSLQKVSDTEGIYFDNGNLYRINVITWDITLLDSGYSIGLRTSYVQIGPKLYFTNGKEHGRIYTPTWEVLAGFGTETPTLNVDLSELGYGQLAVGRYFISISFVDAYGEESASPELHFIETTVVGGIGITLSGVVPSAIERIRIYATGANGDRKELFRVTELDATDTFYAYVNNEFGSPLITLFKEVIPVPSLITAYNGHLYFAVNNVVYHSEAFNYGLYHEDHNQVGVYGKSVTVLERGLDGIWVIAEITNAYVGDNPKNFILVNNTFNFPAVKFSGTQVEGDLFNIEGIGGRDVPYWFSSRGAVIGLQSGTVLALSKDKAEPEKFNVGASGTVEYNGVRSLLTALDEHQGPNDSVSLQDTFAVQVINRGIS